MAKKRLLTGGADDITRVLVEVAPSAETADFGRRVAEVGGVVGSWVGEARLMVIEIPAARLGDLARLDGVTYVELDQSYPV